VSRDEERVQIDLNHAPLTLKKKLEQEGTILEDGTLNLSIDLNYIGKIDVFKRMSADLYNMRPDIIPCPVKKESSPSNVKSIVSKPAGTFPRNITKTWDTVPKVVSKAAPVAVSVHVPVPAPVAVSVPVSAPVAVSVPVPVSVAVPVADIEIVCKILGASTLRSNDVCKVVNQLPEQTLDLVTGDDVSKDNITAFKIKFDNARVVYNHTAQEQILGFGKKAKKQTVCMISDSASPNTINTPIANVAPALTDVRAPGIDNTAVLFASKQRNDLQKELDRTCEAEIDLRNAELDLRNAEVTFRKQVLEFQMKQHELAVAALQEQTRHSVENTNSETSGTTQEQSWSTSLVDS